MLPQDHRWYNDDDAHSPAADDKMIFEFSTANGGVYRYRAGNNYILKRTTRLHRLATAAAAARCTLLAPSYLSISSLCSSSHHLESSKHCTIQTDEVNFYVHRRSVFKQRQQHISTAGTVRAAVSKYMFVGKRNSSFVSIFLFRFFRCYFVFVFLFLLSTISISMGHGTGKMRLSILFIGSRCEVTYTGGAQAKYGAPRTRAMQIKRGNISADTDLSLDSPSERETEREREDEVFVLSVSVPFEIKFCVSSEKWIHSLHFPSTAHIIISNC